jgi:hypothetical protein
MLADAAWGNVASTARRRALSEGTARDNTSAKSLLLVAGVVLAIPCRVLESFDRWKVAEVPRDS